MDSLPLPITDIILIVILIWGAIAGFKKGLILTLASFIAIIVGAGDYRPRKTRRAA
jgi:uncharacterized membrane protein required for colicin V production